MNKNNKKCCKEIGVPLDESDRKILGQEVHLPEYRPGIGHKILNKFHRRGIKEAKVKAVEFLSSNGSMNRIRIRYKPREITAYYIQSDDSKRNSMSGWLIPGPGGAVFYVPEDAFSETFEFVEDEGRVVA